MEEYTPKKKSWFKRNWPWVVPLGGCMSLIGLFIIFVGTAIFGVTQAFTNSTPFKDALEKVNQDAYVINILGEPIEQDGIMSGKFNFTNGKGSADMSIPIKGPEGEGDLYVIGTKENEIWTYSEMYVIIDETNEQIDILGYEQDKNDQPEEEEW